MSTENTSDTVKNNVFTWSGTKADRVMIYWCGRQVMVVKGERAVKLMDKLAQANVNQQQQLLAKITGNFKRGNEQKDPGK